MCVGLEVGESMEETVRREIAEELGIDCIDVRYSGMSQPWPFPNSSMMCAFTAIADPNAKV
jgi:NAD+ diphosphatase